MASYMKLEVIAFFTIVSGFIGFGCLGIYRFTLGFSTGKILGPKTFSELTKSQRLLLVTGSFFSLTFGAMLLIMTFY